MIAIEYPTINLIANGDNIKRLRKEKGISVKQLQEFFGFEQPQAIYKWQWGACLPSIDHLFALSKILQVPIEKILVENDQDFLFSKLTLIHFINQYPENFHQGTASHSQ